MSSKGNLLLTRSLQLLFANYGTITFKPNRFRIRYLASDTSNKEDCILLFWGTFLRQSSKFLRQSRKHGLTWCKFETEWSCVLILGSPNRCCTLAMRRKSERRLRNGIVRWCSCLCWCIRKTERRQCAARNKTFESTLFLFFILLKILILMVSLSRRLLAHTVSINLVTEKYYSFTVTSNFS